VSTNAKRADHAPIWQLQEAKARLSELVRRAVDEGPQHVSIRGEPAAVVLSEDLVEAINDRPRGPDRNIDF
jgi:prevent-host-death family protein